MSLAVTVVVLLVVAGAHVGARLWALLHRADCPACGHSMDLHDMDRHGCVSRTAQGSTVRCGCQGEDMEDEWART